MNQLASEFDELGYVVVDNLLSQSELLLLDVQCQTDIGVQGRASGVDDGKVHVGTRNLLQLSWVKLLAAKLAKSEQIALLLPRDFVCLQCNFFIKTMSRNWRVALHQDLSIPVHKRFNVEGWKGWSIKEGGLFVQPPKSSLNDLVIARLHIENTDAENSALEVIPGSHRTPNVAESPITVPVGAGSVMLMRPLLMHGSDKLKSGSRRVLHFVFAPKNFPGPGQWPLNVTMSSQ